MFEFRSEHPVVQASVDEAGLLAALQAGQEWAHEATVRTFGPRLLAVARRFARNEGEARALVERACLSAFRALDGLGGHQSLGPWLHRIVVSTAIQRLRSRQAEPEVSIEPLLPRFHGDGGHAKAPGADGLLDEEALGGKETREAVRACIAHLPESHRTLLLLCDVEGLSTQEAAEALAITAATARLRLHRARQALLTLLHQRVGHTGRAS